ncbi:MAG: hypothetical protein AB1486_16080 [Planctomycetota bacterium]
MRKLLLALLFPPLLLCLLELVLALAGIAPAPRFYRESVAADGSVQLVLDRETPWGKNPPFQPPSFPLAKDPHAFRIFCLGDSTVNGTPFSRHSSFVNWLRVRLEQLHPARRFEVVRMAADARAAREVAELCREVVHYAPDLVIVYTGHNEFLFKNLLAVRNPLRTRLHELVRGCHLGRLLASLCPETLEPLPGLVKNPVRLVADEPFLTAGEIEQGYRYYRGALTEIVQACRDAGVRLLVCRPACNLRDYEPRRSFFAAAVDGAARARFRELFAEGEQLLERECFAEALHRFEEASGVDPTPALLRYRMARCLEGLGDRARARTEYELARDRDNHPNRATARHLQLIDEIAPPFAVIADCQSVFDSASATGVAGNDLLVDNVHPDLDAQNLIAEAVLRAMAREGLLAPESAWRFEDEPDVGEYRRRMGLDLREIATSFTEYAFSNLVRVYGQKESADPLSATERLLRFALRYDSENASAHFSLAIVHALRGETEPAREHLERSRRGDPSIVTAFLGMARRDSSLAPMASRLQGLLAEGGGK